MNGATAVPGGSPAPSSTRFSRVARNSRAVRGDVFRYHQPPAGASGPVMRADEHSERSDVTDLGVAEPQQDVT